MADAPAWFEDEFPTDGPRSRRRILLLVALVAVSWVVVALVLVRGQGATPAATATDDPAVAAGPPEPDAAVATGPAGGGDDRGGAAADREEPADEDPAGEGGDATGADTATSELGPEEPTAPIGRDEAEAVAVAVLRGWLSDGGPDLPIDGVEVDRRAYLEHVALEAFDVPSHEIAVARLLVVLLVREDDRYTDAIVRRAAVPLTLTATSVRPGGQPWWLPSRPDLTPRTPDATPVTDAGTVADVTAALDGAGYRDATVTDVGVTDGGTLVADVTARTGEGDPVDGPVWLHPGPDGLLVLGGPHTTDDHDAPADARPPD